LAKKKAQRRQNTRLVWTQPRKEIADLVAQGKGFMEIVSLGYSKTMTSVVMNALKKGETPAEPDETDPAGQGNGDGNGKDNAKPLISTASSKSAPIIFRLGQKEIVLDPMELYNQHRYYLDLCRRNGGITETFSEVLTLGMQVLWALHQDVPMTENMLKAIFSK
jgi:hypothetical protein